jgi:hypothetical protein
MTGRHTTTNRPHTRNPRNPMRVRALPFIATLAGAGLAAAAFAVIAPDASAYSGTGTGAFAGAPAWVQTDAARKGSVLFYDADGTQIASGTDIQKVGAIGANFGYLAVKNGDGSVTNLGPGAGAIKANALLAAPDPANANISTWAVTPIPPTNYQYSPPKAGVPAAVSANPAFLKLNSLGQAFQDVATGVVLYTGANAEYKNVLEIRVQDTVDTAHYWATDIEYNPTGAASAYDGLAPGAWKVVWPSATVAVGTTTTTPTVAPTGASQPFGTSVTFSTTVAASSGSIASGTVKFFYDGTHQIGATKNVSTVGTTPVDVSSDAVTDIPVGSHTITAQFTPGDSGFSTSTSSGLSYAVVGTATSATTPTSTPDTPVTSGTSVTFHTTVAASSGSIAGGGTVQFLDGATPIGTTKNVAGPIGTTPVTVDSDATAISGVSTHSITAVFTPADAGFAAATSSVYSLVVTAAPADTTATALVASPGSTADSGTAVGLTATVTDSTSATHPTGSVTFKDGGTTLGSVTLAAGTDANASVATYTIPKVTLSIGAHHFSAEFVPTGNFTASTSPTVDYAITLAAPSNIGAPSTGAVRVGSVATCNPGTWLNAGAFAFTWSQRASSSASWAQFATAQSSGVIPASYAGHQVKCSVVAFSPAVPAGTAAVDSATGTVALGAASKATKAPRILGTPKVGKRLSAYVGAWSPKPASYQYVWKIGTKVVSRAATWTPSKAYKGKYVTLTVYAKRTGYVTGAATSGRVRIG